MLSKFKIIDKLFKHPIINLNDLKVVKIMNKRRDAQIVHYTNSITGDNYVGKMFNPITFITVR